MAGQRRSKGNAGRKVKDKWKSKEWYNVHAPRMFNETVIGETPASDPELLMGRTIDVTVQELTGDMSKMHIKLKFQVSGVDGHEAKTSFMGHDFTSDYVRRLTRRKKTKTDHVVDVTTSDSYVLRVKTMSISDKRIQSSQEVAMRQIIEATLKEMGPQTTLSEMIKKVISGDLAKDLAKACHVIIPIKRIEIRKTEVLSIGEGEPESIIEALPAETQEVSIESPVEASKPVTEDEEKESAEESEEDEPAEEEESEE